MSLTSEERNIVVGLELEKARNVYSQVQIGVDNRVWDFVANRLYYAAFHAVSALLIHSGIQVGSHKGAVMMFRQHFIRTSIFTQEEGHTYSRLQQLREESDYNCYIQTSEQEIVPYITLTKVLIDKIELYIANTPAATLLETKQE